MLRLRWAADGLIGLSAAIGTAGLVLEVVVILIDVIGRYFHAPLRGAQDISQMTMVIIVFGGMALCDKVGGHVSVDLFERVFPEWMNRLIDIIAALLGAVIFLTLAWSIYESAKLSLMLNLATNIIQMPKAYFQWALAAFAIVTALGMALRVLELSLGGPRASHSLEAEL